MRIRIVLGLVLLPTVISATCHDDAMLAATADVPYASAGTSSAVWPIRCYFEDGSAPFTDNCEGYQRGGSAGKGGNDAASISWLKGLKWHKEATTVMRKTTGGGYVSQTVRAIVGPTHYAFRDLGTRGLVVARITGDADGPDDAIYGIGASRTKGWQDDFFLVIEDVQLPQPPVGEKPESYRVARWNLVGIDANRKLGVVSYGTTRFCKRMHSDADRKRASRFISCSLMTLLSQAVAGDTALSRIGVDRLLDSLRLLPPVAAATSDSGEFLRRTADAGIRAKVDAMMVIRRVLREEATDPAWVVCGIGCCTAEDPQFPTSLSHVPARGRVAPSFQREGASFASPTAALTLGAGQGRVNAPWISGSTTQRTSPTLHTRR